MMIHLMTSEPVITFEDYRISFWEERIGILSANSSYFDAYQYT